MKTSRDLSIDLIRSIACLAVVIMHCTALFWYPVPVLMDTISGYSKGVLEYQANPNTFNFGEPLFLFCSFLDSLTRFCVPVFIMISGALILRKEEITIRYTINKTIHILKIILLWGGILTALEIILAFGIGKKLTLLYIVQIWINGSGVFWFLYMLIPLYLASPIFSAITKNRNALILAIVIWFATSICFPTIRALIPSLSGNVKLEFLTILPAYTGYFLLGFLLRQELSSMKKHAKPKMTSSVIVALIFSIIVCLIVMTFAKPIGLFHNFLNPLVVIYSTLVFSLLSLIKFGGTI